MYSSHVWYKTKSSQSASLMGFVLFSLFYVSDID